MSEEYLEKVLEEVNTYWDAEECEVDTANNIANYAYSLVKEVRRLKGIIEEADTEASLRRYDSFDRINDILSKRFEIE